jgi:hypothetical protein
MTAQVPWGLTVIGKSTGRGVAEPSVLVLPRKIDTSKRIVFFGHGANGQGTDLVHPAFKNLRAKVFTAAQAGYIVLCADFGGPQTYGSDALLTNVETWWTWAKAQGFCATDKLIGCGASMGTLTMHRFARDHPDQVAGLGCFIPYLDVEYARTNDLLSIRALINTTWGMPVGSYIGGTDQTPIPTRGRPLDYASTLSSIPTELWYSTADPISTNIGTYAAARTGVTLHVTSTSLTHGDPAVGTDNAGFLSFVQSVGVAA